MSYSISPDARHLHAQRSAAGLLPSALGLPFMTRHQRKRFIEDIAQRGLANELEAILDDEMKTDAEASRDLVSEDPRMASLCRYRERQWLLTQRALRACARRYSLRVRSKLRTKAQTSRGLQVAAGAERSIDAWLAELTAEIRALRVEVEALHTNLRPPERAVMTLDQAAIYLDVSRRTLDRFIARGQLKVSKLTPGDQGGVRVTRSRLDQFLEERTQ